MPSANLRSMRSEAGPFLYDPASMQIFVGANSQIPLLPGRSAAVVAEDYARATINVVKGCNLGCQYCPYGSSGPDRGKMEKMPVEVGRAVIDFLCTTFRTQVKQIKISFTPNGEPSLNLDTIQAIKTYARALSDQHLEFPRFRFNFATNAIALTDAALSQLGEDPDQDVFFSVDGYPELHDRIRPMCGEKSSYELVASKVQFYRDRCRTWGKRLISSTVLTALDERFDQILTHLDHMGFESIVMRPIRGFNDTPLGLNPSTVQVFLNGYRRMIDIIEQSALSGDIRLLQKVCNRYDFFGRLFATLILGEERQQGCPGCPPNYSNIVRYSLVFDTNGDVYFPCRDFVGLPDYCLGNIFGSVNLNRMEEVMETLRTINRPACRDCWARTLCGGGCYNAALLSTGQIIEPDANLCRVILYLAERAVQLAHAMAIRQPDKLQHLMTYAKRMSPWYK